MVGFTLEKITGPMACGEAPHWDSNRKCLYFVDIPKSLVFRYVPATQQLFQAKVNAKYVSLILPIKGTEDKFIVGIERSLAIMQWNGISPDVGELNILSSVEANRYRNRFNDGKCDAVGRVFAGTMGSQVDGVWEEKRGALYSFGKEKQIITQLEDVGIANGLAWSEDNKTFYYVDSLAYSIDAFDYDITTGKLSKRRVIFELKKNGINSMADGMTIDTTGNLWLALYGGSGIIVVDPKQGKIIRKISIPGRDITSVVFGGDNLDELYVTSAYQDLPEGEADLNKEAGCTFRIKGLGAKGYDSVSVNLC